MSNKRYDEIINRVTAFRHEQESKLLSSNILGSSSWEQKQSLSKSLSNNISKLVVSNKNSKESNEFSKLVENNVLIVASSVVNKSCWPLSLISTVVFDEREEHLADLGTIDSHGSIWKMLRRPDAYPGTRIILQANEIGEIPTFLCADLTLTPLAEQAAIWNVYTVTLLDNNGNPVDTSDKSIRDGVLVRFELFEGPAVGYGIKQEIKYLVSVISKTQLRGIAVMTEKEMTEEEKDGNFCFGIQWEIISEDVNINDPDVNLLIFDN